MKRHIKLIAWLVMIILLIAIIYLHFSSEHRTFTINYNISKKEIRYKNGWYFVRNGNKYYKLLIHERGKYCLITNLVKNKKNVTAISISKFDTIKRAPVRFLLFVYNNKIKYVKISRNYINNMVWISDNKLKVKIGKVYKYYKSPF